MKERVDSEGRMGYVIPVRNPAHADPEWFQTDLDDAIEDPDAPFIDPLPTDRHKRVPGFDYGD
ncbi:hypothetical protein K0U83_11785 [bacterium]|nr:hypothetical protein [bacterium]